MNVFKSKHVGCYGVVINDNKVLLIKKARGAYKGKLDLPGGGIEYGETVDDTLKREFLEETNMLISDYKLRTVITHYEVWNIDDDNQEDLTHIAIIYDVVLPREYVIKRDADGLDSLGAEWYDIDELSMADLSPLAQCIKNRD